MANKLDSIVKINGADYEVVAEEAKKVTGTLNITRGSTPIASFDGSKTVDIDLAKEDSAESAETVKVALDDDKYSYAAITVSIEEPSDGKHGDIWFKYQ